VLGPTVAVTLGNADNVEQVKPGFAEETILTDQPDSSSRPSVADLS
jgi:hypothetical protein